MEQQIFTITVRRPLTRMERLRLRRRRNWEIARTALWILAAAAMVVAALIYGGKAPAAGTAGVAEDGEQTVRVIFLPAEEFLQIEEQPAGEPEELEEERELIARIVYLEARGEPAEGQQAVAEVILNRVAAENFPDTVADVVYQENPQQFTTEPFVDEATPGADQYAAVDAAINGEAVLPMDVVYFSREPENGNVWGTIGGHVFCYQYT